MKKPRLIALVVVALIIFSGLLKIYIFPQIGLNWATVLPAVVALLTNDERSAQSVAKLNVDAKLTKAAEAKARDMAAKGYFAHVSPDGTQPWFWILKEEYLYKYAGENLAVNFEDSDEVVEAWMKSPGHRLNILKPQYTDIGIGTATGTYQGRPATFVVQMFGSPAKPVSK
ncbi:hypothetical protein KW796_02015 [Candidatus Parcubacteria bacterium]|nr:hypothetical protein [Candidatus Parcubacteria bacterium]